MKTTEQEKELLNLFRKIETQKNKDDLLFWAETMVRTQNAVKADYGLIGKDVPLFNSLANASTK